jgi:hypothetical protein
MATRGDVARLQHGMLDPARRQDLLMTAVMIGVVLTPAWFLPAPWSQVWQLVTLLVGAPALWWSATHAPYHPTPAAETARVVAALNLAPGQRFCDLGAGDGGLLLRVRAATGATAHGIEASPLPWLVARWRTRGVDGVSLAFGDLYRADLSSFDAVYVWGTAYGTATDRFVARMRATMKPGARLVSYHHALPGLAPTHVDREGQRPLFVYAMPPSDMPLAETSC